MSPALGTVPTVLVHGTHGYTGSRRDTAAWWWPGDATSTPSAFVREARRQGVEILGTGDPFEWAAGVGGFWGRRRRLIWKAAGQALRWYAVAHGVRELNVVAHSHAGQLAAYAAFRRVLVPRIRTLVTVATPVRADMLPVYRGARARVLRWVHVHAGERDWWQILGELGDGHVGWSRVMAEAHENVAEPGADHSSLFDPGLWTDRDWWRYLR